MSRVTSGLVTINRAALDVNALLPDALEQAAPLLEERRHHVTVQHAPGPAVVLGDRTRLVQVLANLLHNAAKYTPPGGEITLRVDTQEDYVALAVRDNGVGMSAELAERAFVLFEQGQRTPDRAQGGLGIGLALVKAIVELHGGTVIAHSAGAGQGSEFLVLLPRSREHSAAHERPVVDALLAAPGTHELKILIVDDNIDAARMLAMLIEAAGHRAHVAHQPQEALALASQVVPDVCLLDIGLPVMNGNELAQRLRAGAETSHAVLVAVTGYAAQHDGARAAGPEFDHHLVKPIDTGQLLGMLRQISPR
jgi:CheY-like chemotaxis protein/two-component sensor histidine kinase